MVSAASIMSVSELSFHEGLTPGLPQVLRLEPHGGTVRGKPTLRIKRFQLWDLFALPGSWNLRGCLPETNKP